MYTSSWIVEPTCYSLLGTGDFVYNWYNNLCFEYNSVQDKIYIVQSVQDEILVTYYLYLAKYGDLTVMANYY